MNYIAAIDLSMRATGIVVLTGAGQMTHSTVIGATLKDRPARILADRIAYYCEIAELLKEILRPLIADGKTTIVIEGYGINSRDPVRAAEMGGIARERLLSLGCEVKEIPPASLKKWCAGIGDASKEEMIEAVRKRWGFVTESNDLADAYALAQWARGCKAAEPLKKGTPRPLKIRKPRVVKPAKAAKKGGAKAATPQPAATIGGIPTAKLPF